jgi:hypothetical protein
MRQDECTMAASQLTERAARRKIGMAHFFRTKENVMRKILVAFVFAIVAMFCGDSGVARAKGPAPLPRSALESVVRLDAGGSYRGSAVVVSTQGYLVTSREAVRGYKFGNDFTVTDARCKAKVVAVDDAHEIALVHAECALHDAAVFEGAARRQAGRASIVRYVDTGSSPPMIERRERPARVSDPHFSGQSSGTLDLHDLLIVAVNGTEYSGVERNGTAVFLPETGRFAGIVIGTMGGVVPTRLIVIPAATIAAFLATKDVSVTQ